MTLREFFANGGVRAELKAYSGRRPTYAQEMQGLSYKMQTADMRHLLRKFARDALAQPRKHKESSQCQNC